ncbi:hypothetical protein JOL62DRAFT_53392 [Phyllosticta paracitricarpa]|uniref:Uncharacterized protein n=1 Tax=Phyllosticta paracitricarpa TaxID=2016321 RepID=A0ABR1ND49_9PEZI
MRHLFQWVGRLLPPTMCLPNSRFVHSPSLESNGPVASIPRLPYSRPFFFSSFLFLLFFSPLTNSKLHVSFPQYPPPPPVSVGTFVVCKVGR